jgi:hypothetical protein
LAGLHEVRLKADTTYNLCSSSIEVSFRTRLEQLEDEISADLWENVGAPVFLNDAWKF